MNAIRATQRRNEAELAAGLVGASWHDEFKNSAYVYVGGLDNELTEGDVITIMSQYGEIADVNMPKNKETGKSQGFGFIMYEDQRSTVLAVDNLNGASVLGRTLRVDHVKNYKQMERGEDGKMKERETQSLNALPENFTHGGAADRSGSETPDPDIDPDDPMAAYLLQQKREQKSKKASKHRGETEEERRARKERKRAKKAAAASRDEQLPRRRERSHSIDQDGRRRKDDQLIGRGRDISPQRNHSYRPGREDEDHDYRRSHGDRKRIDERQGRDYDDTRRDDYGRRRYDDRDEQRRAY